MTVNGCYPKDFSPLSRCHWLKNLEDGRVVQFQWCEGDRWLHPKSEGGWCNRAMNMHDEWEYVGPVENQPIIFDE